MKYSKTTIIYLIILLFATKISSGFLVAQEDSVGYGVNYPIVKRLANDRMIDLDFDLCRAWAYGNLDVPTIVFRMARTSIPIALARSYRISELLKRYDLLSPRLEATLDQCEKIGWHAKYAWIAVFYAAIKDHMEKRDVRETIVKNFLTLGYNFTDFDKVSADFINGEIDIGELLTAEDSFLPVREGVVEIDSLGKVLREFFLSAFQDRTAIQFSEGSETFIVHANGHDYSLKTKDLYVIEGDGAGMLDSKPKTIPLNQYFYYGLWDILNQIAYDVKSDYKFGIYPTHAIYSGMHSDQYIQVLKHFPEFKLSNANILLKKLSRHKKSLDDIPTWTRIDESTKSCEELEIMLITISEEKMPPAGWTTTVSTDQKIALLEYLTIHRQDYLMTQDDISQASELIMGRFMIRTHQLLSKVPLTMVEDGPQVNIDSMGHNFDEAYPMLYRMFRGEFNVKLEKLGHGFLQFTYQNQLYKSDTGREHMQETIMKVLQTFPASGRERYQFSDFDYYLNSQEAADLGTILNVKFKRKPY